ncbi:MAG: 16S rRNA (guanine(966)-N(2))-methyltransferase RsmD [Pseudomonadota bacterium]
MRIVGGSARGTALASVGKGDPAAHLRPTTDRVRESLFNLLAHAPFAPDWEGVRVLDLFAGTGALGLEALSRGAIHATFIDTGRKSLGLLTRNISHLRVQDRATILKRDARRPGPGTPHHVVFLDPPYGTELGAAALTAAMRSGWIAPGALIVWEDSALHSLPEGMEALDQRSYGGTRIQIARASSG